MKKRDKKFGEKGTKRDDGSVSFVDKSDSKENKNKGVFKKGGKDNGKQGRKPQGGKALAPSMTKGNFEVVK